MQQLRVSRPNERRSTQKRAINRFAIMSPAACKHSHTTCHGITSAHYHSLASSRCCHCCMQHMCHWQCSLLLVLLLYLCEQLVLLLLRLLAACVLCCTCQANTIGNCACTAQRPCTLAVIYRHAKYVSSCCLCLLSLPALLLTSPPSLTCPVLGCGTCR